jgi:hypothetical protein
LTELDYELRNDGVLYRLGDDTHIRVQGSNVRRVTVTLQRGDELVPPETGNLGGSTLRNKLVSLAEERFGEVNGLAEDLGSIAAVFGDHLREREEAADDYDQETNEPEFVGTPYRISEDGGFVRIRHTQGGEIPQVLTNFLAWVEEEVVRDDGAEQTRIYKISGRIGDSCLPKVDVPVSQFSSMSWVAEHWGLAAHITAGQHQYAKEAVELYSRSALKSYRFAHTGWRILEDDTRVYLHSGGAIV